jgi:hypothetical protein
MAEKVCTVAPARERQIISDYSHQTTVRTITVVQKYQDSAYSEFLMPVLETTEDVIRSIDYGVKLRVVDKTTTTRIYTF